MDVEVQNPQDLNWLGRKWSAWITLAEALSRGLRPPRQPGIYRIRDGRNKDTLLYIGQSDDIRRRLRNLRASMIKVSRGEPQRLHWAGECIAKWQQSGASIEASWLEEVVEVEAERKGLECEYIAAHRWFTKKNPECQFVAMNRR